MRCVAPCALSTYVDESTASLMSTARLGGEGSSVIPMKSARALR
jgi:hypothetical protein